MLRKLIWVLLFLPFIEFSAGTPGESEKIKPFNNNTFRETGSHSPELAVVGDLQRTSLPEILMNREQNDFEREQIVEAISKESLSGVILLGDLVFEGADDEEWKYFDNLTGCISSNGIPMFSLMGNHEYYGRNRTALAHVSSRFPQIALAQTWYCLKADSICLVFLDSNYGVLGERKWNEELNWLKESLRKDDNDISIKGIIVFLHHPPYSNSLIIGDNEKLQKDLVPIFNSSRKTIAMISGHAHTYERFESNGKAFIISGGGGGPRVNLNNGEMKHKDLCCLPSPRPFNYLILKRNNDKIEVTVKGLNKGENKF
ncbi:MAG TPA: metallophosphoesterase, partial [Ignavibacteriaceae bacterium]|nr:metallophosphoesterase [Ignavibacteriaceae bacterium]